MNYWEQFKGEKWKEEINVSDFLINNYTAYTGNEEFLEGVCRHIEPHRNY